MELMKFCSGCGRIISKKFKFCPHCGDLNKKKLSPDKTEDIPSDRPENTSKEKFSLRLEYLEIVLEKMENELTQFLSTRSG